MPVLTASTTDEAASLLADAPSPVVVIPIYNACDAVRDCLEAVAAYTGSSIAILVVDDAGTDRRALNWLKASSASIAQRVIVLEHRENRGFVRSCNEAFTATPGRDVVLLNSDVIVGAEWLERLQETAYSSNLVATATTLTNHGTIVSVPGRNQPVRTLPNQMTPAEAARRVAAGSRKLRPSIPTAVGHCFYIRRHALNLVGPFDEAFNPGYCEEVDFSQRAVAHGFRHMLADDVFTYHRGSVSFGDGPEVAARRLQNHALIHERYPSYVPWVERVSEEEASTLADALAAARHSLLGVTVGVDALCLGPHRLGTHYNVIESIRALAQQPEIQRLVAFVPMEIAPEVEEMRDELPQVEFMRLNLENGIPERVVDVIYRPYQVSSHLGIEFLHRAADRFVVNQLDTIAFGNPTYFGTHDEWLTYRNVTRLTLKLAHGVAFLSESARQTAQADGLLDPGKPSAVVSCGADGPLIRDPEARPVACSPTDDGFLLCIGASYLHKNRPFALELWAELRRRGWRGRLVLAGPAPPHGNSLAREAELLREMPDLRADVVALAAISEAEKRWLYRHAALVLYPSTVEGFGLVPLEAARYGVPTLATRQGSLDEVLPPDIPVLDGFDVSKGADRAWQLLHDSDLAKKVVCALQERGRSFTWSATARKLIGLFDEARRGPQSRLLLMDGEGGKPVGLRRAEVELLKAREATELRIKGREEAELLRVRAEMDLLKTREATDSHTKAREEAELLRVRAEIELLKAREATELRIKAREEAELLRVRAEIEALQARTEVELLTARVHRLENEIAVLRETRTWRLRNFLIRSRLLRSLFARPTPVSQ